MRARRNKWACAGRGKRERRIERNKSLKDSEYVAEQFMQSDAILYDRWRRHGDEGAFETLAHRHASLITDVAYRIGGDRQTAEDALQESLIALAHDRSDRPTKVGVRAWLARASISKAKNARASQGYRRNRERAVGLDQPEQTMSKSSRPARDVAIDILGTLDADDAVTLSLRFIHNTSYAELAAILHVSEPTARVRVHRALQRARASHGQLPLDEREAGAQMAAIPVFALTQTTVNRCVKGAMRPSRGPLLAERIGARRAGSKKLLLAGAACVVLTAGSLAWTPSRQAPNGKAAIKDAGRPEGQPTLRPGYAARSPTDAQQPSQRDENRSPSKRAPAKAASRSTGNVVVAQGRRPPVQTRLRMRKVLADGSLQDVHVSTVIQRGHQWDVRGASELLQAFSAYPGARLTLATSEPGVATPWVTLRVPDPVPPTIDVRVLTSDASDLDKLTVEVVDADTGDPVPEAVLHWGAFEQDRVRQAADDRGRIVVRGLRPRSWNSQCPSALVHFTASEHIIVAPGYMHAGRTQGLSEYLPRPLVEGEHLSTWMERRVVQIKLRRIPEHDGIVERCIRLVHADGRPLRDAYVHVGHPYGRDRPQLVDARFRPGAEFRRSDAEGNVTFPMGDVVSIAVMIERIPIAAWGLAAKEWYGQEARELRVPSIAHAHIHVTGLPKGSRARLWRHTLLDELRKSHALFEGSTDAHARQFLDARKAILPLPDSISMQQGTEIGATIPHAIGRRQSWYVSDGTETRVVSVYPTTTGDVDIRRRWSELPLETR